MTTAPANQLQPPGAITVLAGDGQLTLRWTPSPSPGVVAYRIYRRNPDGTWPAQPMEGTTHTEYVDLEVQNGVTYAYRIAAIDAAQNVSLAQEATGTPVASASSGKSFSARTAVIVGVLGALVIGFGAYSYGHSQGEKSGDKAGYKTGYEAGVKEGSAQVSAQYAKGATGYKRIYDSGYKAGQSQGKATGKAQGKKQDEEIGYEQGEKAGTAQGEKQGEVKGEEQAYSLALGGYSAWQPMVPYLVNVKSTGNAKVPYGVNQRHIMEPNFDYYLCSSGKSGVCRSSRSSE